MNTTLSNLLGPRPTPPLPTHTITIRDHPEPHIMQWSDLELAAIKKYAEQYALQDRAQVQGELEPYDAGLLNDFGGGNVEWWQDYIRAELGHAHDFYQSQIATPQPAQAAQAEVTDGIRPEDFTVDVVVKSMGGFAQINTSGVRVTHKPTGISVTCDAARSQHTNRNQAFEELSAILATPNAQAQPAEVTDEQIKEAAVKAVKDGKLSWLGFEKDDQDKYTIPVISKSHYQFARAILALRPAVEPMTDDVVRDAERGRFLVGWLKRFGLLQTELGQIGAGEKPESWWLLHAPWGIDKTRPFFGHGKTPEQAIDAAMLATKEKT